MTLEERARECATDQREAVTREDLIIEHQIAMSAEAYKADFETRVMLRKRFDEKLDALLETVRREEREACADMFDKKSRSDKRHAEKAGMLWCDFYGEVAAAIRARSEPTGREGGG